MLAQRDVNRLLIADGFYECPMTPCLYRHPTRNLRFVVWVDDFMVVFECGRRVPTASAICAIRLQGRLDWPQLFGPNHRLRQKRTITVYIPGYVKRMLAEVSVVI